MITQQRYIKIKSTRNPAQQKREHGKMLELVCFGKHIDSYKINPYNSNTPVQKRANR